MIVYQVWHTIFEFLQHLFEKFIYLIASSFALINFRIKSQIPAVLNKWATALNENIEEIKSDYVFAMKKAVIDFVLQNSLTNLKKDSHLELTAERKEANKMFNRWRYR